MKRFALLTACCICQILLTAQPGFVFPSGIYLVNSGNPVMVLQDIDLTNNGTITAGTGKVKFAGTIPASINGNTPISFYDLHIISSGGVTLNQNIRIENELQMAGMLNVQNFEVDIQPGATITGETETARLHANAGNTGHAMITLDLDSPVQNLNPANIGVEFVNAPALGPTTITRYCTYFDGGGLIGNKINRYYNINPANNSSLNASVRFYYFDAELNGVIENVAVLWKSTNHGVSWTQVTPDSRDVVNNYLQKNGVDDFSLWTIGSISAPLPIVLSSFNVSCNSKGAQLVWTTAWEENNDRFVVEKSMDGIQWIEIAVIHANNVASNYKFSDTDAGTAFYRLKQVDKDGTFTYSKILLSNCAVASITLLLYPNPVHDIAEMVFQSEKDMNGTVQIFSSNGQLIKNIKVQIQKGLNKIKLNLPELAKGMYVLKLHNGDVQVHQKFIKE